MRRCAMGIESRLIVILLVDQIAPRVFARPLNYVQDASRFAPGFFLQLTERHEHFIFMSGLYRYTHNQDEHSTSQQVSITWKGCRIPGFQFWGGLTMKYTKLALITIAIAGLSTSAFA